MQRHDGVVMSTGIDALSYIRPIPSREGGICCMAIATAETVAIENSQDRRHT
jgi:hypothetical protein